MRRLLLLATLAACGGRPSVSDGNVISFWHIQSAGSALAMIQRQVERFQRENPGIVVDAVAVQNDPYKTKLKLAMGTGRPPCVFSNWGGGSLREYVAAGQVLDLTPYMSGYADRFLPAALAPATIDGRIYAVPVENTAVGLVFYNKALFRRLGLVPPRTYDELLQVVRRLRAAGVAPFALANKTKWPGAMHYAYLLDRLAGPKLFTDALEGRARFDDERFVRAGELLRTLVDAGAFSDGAQGLDYDTGQSRLQMYGGRAAMELMGSWNLFIVRDERPAFFRTDFDFFAYPSVPGGHGDPRNLVGAVGDQLYAIAANCPHPREAFRLIQTLIDDRAVVERAAEGRIPPVAGFRHPDPLFQRVVDVLQAAPAVQLWHDQALPPRLAEIHNEGLQELLTGTRTPAQVFAELASHVR